MQTDIVQLTHPEAHKVARHFNADPVSSLEELRSQIITDARAFAGGDADVENEFKGACFEVWGECFVNFFCSHPRVGFQKESYTPILKGKDYGVDGWGKSSAKGNPTRTVQYKFRSSPKTLITYPELAKFKDQSREDYRVSDNDQMIFITLAQAYNENAESQARGVILLGWHQLKEIIGDNQDFWKTFRTSLAKAREIVPHVKKSLAPHQELIVQQTSKFLESDSQDRGYILCGTGGGKTLAMQATAIEYLSNHGDLVVVAAPRIQLVNQIAMEFLQQDDDFDWLTFHSGSKVEYQEVEDDGSWRQEIQDEQHLKGIKGKATTSLDDVTSLLNQRDGKIVLFTTYHSSARLLDHLQRSFLYLADECHNLVTPEFGQILERDDIEKLIGFTATIEETEDVTDCGMNNYSLWGHELADISPADLVGLGFTVPPLAYTAKIETSHDVEDVVAEATAEIIRRFKDDERQGKSCRIIVNCSSCAVAHDLANSEILKQQLDDFVYTGGPEPEPALFVVTSYRDKMGSRTREQELEKFSKSHNAVIFHYSMLGEGIDVPGVTAVLSWRDLSVRDSIQLVGRAGRIVPEDREALARGEIEIGNPEGWNKPFAYVLCPIIEGSLESENAYKGMIRILERLRADDRCISEYVRGAKSTGRYKQSAFPVDKHIGASDPDNIELECEDQLSVSQAFACRTQEELLEKIKQDIKDEEARAAQRRKIAYNRAIKRYAYASLELSEERVHELKALEAKAEWDF